MANKSTNDHINLLLNLRIHSIQNEKSPHKYIFLFCIIKLYNKDPNRLNEFPLDEELDSIFKQTWLEFFPNYNTQKIFIEYPYYHLSNEGFWNLKVIENKKKVFDYYTQSKKRLTKKRLVETVEYGYFDDVLHSLFSNEEKRAALSKELLIKIKNLSLDEKFNNTDKPSSLFSHEAMAIKDIETSIQPRNLGYLCSNIEIHDPQSNRYFEIDVLIVSRFGIYVVELKHWTGNVEVCPYNWFVNGMSRADPHKTNNFKAKLIKGLCEQKFSYLKIPFAASIVVLTHPQINVENASSPKTTKGQPTFDSINSFVDYLKFQDKTQQQMLSNKDAKDVRDFILSLHQPGKPRDIQFPGYKIVKRLYQAEDREELIAHPTDVHARRLTRFRIFFNSASYQSGVSREYFERAKATLEAVSNIGNHLNILQVFSIPSQEGHLIEGSDWSEQGTLRDLISKSAPLEQSSTLDIVTGILSGLEAIHKKGVVHRNLRPENILMVEGIPKIMNFDLSYQMVDDRLTVIPDPSQLRRDAYIAPEIYMGKSFDDNADLFSLGVVFYELVTGEKPFKCSLDLEKDDGKIIQACREQLSDLSIPNDLLSAIESLIQVDRSNRPASAENVLDFLSKYRDQKQSIPNQPLHPGDTHDHYKIIEFLKNGAESQLYKAYGMSGELLFLKLFNIDVPHQRINQEKKLSASVTHSCIVKAENCYRWAGERWFLDFKWIDGKPLLSEKPENLPDIETFGEVAKALLKALEALHGFEDDGEKMPILHNDIKPDNILLTQDYRPKLIDFGIASNPGTFLYAGTTGYVPPDSFSGEDREYSIHGDLALGLHCLNGFSVPNPMNNFV
jgi:serine/threonine protein kinase